MNNTVQSRFDILQELNKQYDNEPTEQTAQKIIDFVENELKTSYALIVEPRTRSSFKSTISLFSGAVISVITSNYVGSAWVNFVVFFISIFATFNILKFVEKQTDKTWKFRHYVVLKEKHYKEAKKAEIESLKDKYLNASASADAPC